MDWAHSDLNLRCNNLSWTKICGLDVNSHVTKLTKLTYEMTNLT